MKTVYPFCEDSIFILWIHYLHFVNTLSSIYENSIIILCRQYLHFVKTTPSVCEDSIFNLLNGFSMWNCSNCAPYFWPRRHTWISHKRDMLNIYTCEWFKCCCCWFCCYCHGQRTLNCWLYTQSLCSTCTAVC